jgi:putative ABC transport system ATP-binding protein
VQLPPEVLGDFPPGTLFAVDHADDTVTMIADRPTTT